MNVILTCAGRRNYLIRYFQEALAARGAVFASDCDPYAAALQEADRAFVLPPFEHDDYCTRLLEACEQYNVRMLIPLVDPELPLIAQHRERFREIGTLAVVASPDVVNICYDKWETYRFLIENGFPAPETYLSLSRAREALAAGEVRFPLMVKHRWGSASVGIITVHDHDELTIAHRRLKEQTLRSFMSTSVDEPEENLLIQEQLLGVEYGLDIVNDLSANHAATFVKRKLSMSGGETNRAVTVGDDALKRVGDDLGRKLRHVGNLDCDVIVGRKGCCVIDMNPRFGGGYPFSHAAGANLPAAFLAWASGEELDKRWLAVESGVLSTKCARIVTNVGLFPDAGYVSDS